MHNVEESTLDMLEEICADDIIREERDIDLFEAGLLDSMAPTAVEREEMNSVNKIIHQIEIRL